MAIVVAHPDDETIGAGGHPDHDAVAFAVHATGLPIIEMAGYHAASDGSIEVGRFLPNGDARRLRLTGTERTCRDAMLSCFTTQRATLAPFVGWTGQYFRPAPRCHYDALSWGMRSEDLCNLAAQAPAC